MIWAIEKELPEAPTYCPSKKRVNSKSSPNNIYKILPKFTNINVSLGKFVYRHTYSSEVYSYFLNLRYFRS